ncbi:CDP-glucose 4,6-dehydratase [Pectinatus cerevisiiphilus]|uniref:CDP-glucose 4,6-dehydratase n=1 Tax=Pectinatus cerevisiiphilus TaxID=86956 RepID=A0A4R3K245_9FIRM|nr:CDP-glucose 4,6-dehydratase [Pectinatus cerevisiiphilus]TCS76023.1 CDP-glucose 4,6-dehydratase [Pectinatus cerevisiiphilus]
MHDLSFYKNKKVFITGHTGFKGSWLCRILLTAGAEITGYSLGVPTEPNLYELAGIDKNINSVIGDISDIKKLENAFIQAKPEIVFHLAAQPLVRESYKEPAYTYETNVMGTVNILECLRKSETVKSFLNITTDKVYKNNEWVWGYRENEPLDGFDPYSNSKSCSELITHSYKQSFFLNRGISISTARAGNVIGGGDFSDDRIIPDCIRAAKKNIDIIVRNPNSTRPYQHVLEPLFAYLLIAEEQYKNIQMADWYNVGPDECDCVTTGNLADLFCKKWGKMKWTSIANKGPHEANFLKLDCSKIKQKLEWKPSWHIEEAIQKTIEWTKVYFDKGNIEQEIDREIEAFRKE